jgi:hypothetical protein
MNREGSQSCTPWLRVQKGSRRMPLGAKILRCRGIVTGNDSSAPANCVVMHADAIRQPAGAPVSGRRSLDTYRPANKASRRVVLISPESLSPRLFRHT